MKDRIKLWFATGWLCTVFSLIVWGILERFFLDPEFRRVALFCLGSLAVIAMNIWSVNTLLRRYE